MDEKIEKAIKPLTEMYEKIENELLLKIAEHFSINEEFLNSDYWRIKKLEEMGLFNQEIVDYLSNITGKTDEEIKKALNQIGIDAININKYNQLFENGLLKVDPKILKNNYTIQNIINLAYNELSNRFIELSKQIEKSTRNAYLNVVESAYLKTTMGTHSYQEAIRTAINDLSNSGITTLTYQTTDENGNVIGIRNYDIEGTVRREVLTNARKLSGAINLEVANELESEYLYISEHLRCRPSHFDWQGTIVKRNDFVRITHYGEVDGIYGINCEHYAEAYFGEKRGDDLKHYSQEECEEAYDLSQHQRYLERGVRKWTRKSEMFKATDDLELYSKAKDKVKEWQLRVKDFTEENNLKRDFTREYVKKSQNSKLEKQYKEHKEAEKVGIFDITKYTKDIKTTTNEVILNDNRREHLKKHPEIEKYIPEIKKILNDPDSVYLELSKEDTVWVVKKLDENLKITLKLNTFTNKKEKGYKNSIIQMQILNEKRIKKYIEKGRIKELFDKNNKK